MEYTLSFKKGKGASGTDLLTFEGSLNVRHIQAIKDALVQEIAHSPALQVKVQNVEQLDLSFLQFLLALKISYKAKQKPICFDLKLNTETERLLCVSGFGEFFHAKS